MQHRHPPRIAIVALIVILLIAAYYSIRAITAAGNGQLKASGTIEAVMVDLGPEMAGKVREVLVEEGEQVAAGAPLVLLDDALIMEQRKAAEAALESAEAAAVTTANALDIARAQYQQVLEAALLRGRQSRLDDWFAKDQVQFNQPEWYFSRSEQIRAMQAHIDQSRQDWEAAAARLQTVLHLKNKAEYQAAEERLLEARDRVPGA